MPYPRNLQRAPRRILLRTPASRSQSCAGQWRSAGPFERNASASGHRSGATRMCCTVYFQLVRDDLLAYDRIGFERVSRLTSSYHDYVVIFTTTHCAVFLTEHAGVKQLGVRAV